MLFWDSWPYYLLLIKKLTDPKITSLLFLQNEEILISKILILKTLRLNVYLLNMYIFGLDILKAQTKKERVLTKSPRYYVHMNHIVKCQKNNNI